MVWKPRTLRSRTLLSYFPALLVTIIATIVVGHAFSLAMRYSDQVLESTRLIAFATELRSNIATAQSSVRGFAITGQEVYLDPYREAEYELRRSQQGLIGTWGERTEQRGQVARALELFFQWREETAEPVIEARRPPIAETTALLVRGRTVMDEANRLLGVVIEGERNLLQVRSLQNDAAARWGAAVAIVAPLLALGYVLLASFLLTRRTVDGIETISRATEDVASGDLSRRVVWQSTDELGAMARTFNLMAERMGQRTAETQRLAELAQLLQVSLSRSEIGELFERFVPKLVPVTGGSLYLRDPPQGVLVRLASWGPTEPLESFSPDDCWAVRLGKTYQSSGGDGPPCDHVEQLGDLCSSCVPMVVHGESLGLIQYVYEPSANAAVRIGIEVAERFAFTLSDMALRERLREQSVRDPLTGLFNRRYLDETLDREIERARRFEQPLGVLMLDLDHFKNLNDTEGHDAGDAFLREFGRLLISAFRTGDEAFRYGGEEFLVLMPDAGVAEVLERAQALRERISKMRAVIGGKVVGPLTASMGVSAFPEDGSSAAELIRAADEALYRAKEEGRDRVVTARQCGPIAPPSQPEAE